MSAPAGRGFRRPRRGARASGLGCDTHSWSPGRRLVIGGVDRSSTTTGL